MSARKAGRQSEAATGQGTLNSSRLLLLPSFRLSAEAYASRVFFSSPRQSQRSPAQGRHPRTKSCNSKKGGCKEGGKALESPATESPRALPSRAAWIDNPHPLPIPKYTVSPGMSGGEEGKGRCLLPPLGRESTVPSHWPADRKL